MSISKINGFFGKMRTLVFPTKGTDVKECFPTLAALVPDSQSFSQPGHMLNQKGCSAQPSWNLH